MSSPQSFADHFSSKAASYSQYRPGYPRELFAWLASLCPVHQRVWDCATGTGQAAAQFTPHFELVIASDASFAQVSKAATEGQYLRTSCLAEQTPFVDDCFDLVTVAQALHWFDLDRFYTEVKRVLKPDGVLAVWSYGLMQIAPPLDSIVNHLYHHTVGPYWPFERKQVENGYRDLAFPFNELSSPVFSMQADWSVQHLLGYLSTWSAVKRYKEDRGVDPLQSISHDLLTAWGEQQTRTVTWPLALRVGTQS